MPTNNNRRKKWIPTSSWFLAPLWDSVITIPTPLNNDTLNKVSYRKFSMKLLRSTRISTLLGLGLTKVYPTIEGGGTLAKCNLHEGILTDFFNKKCFFRSTKGHEFS